MSASNQIPRDPSVAGGVAAAGASSGATGGGGPFSGYTVATLGGNPVVYLSDAVRLAHEAGIGMARRTRAEYVAAALIGGAS